MVNFINQFAGGMSHDDQLMGKDQYVYSHGFDISRYPGEPRLMPILNTHTQIPTKVTCFIQGERETYCGTVDGKIYDFVGVLKLDTGTGQPILNSIIFRHDVTGNAYIYLLLQTSVYVCLEGVAGLGSLALVRNGSFIGKTFGLFNGGELYIPGSSSGASVYNVTAVDKFGNLSNVFTADTAGEILGLSVHGSYLRVYTANSVAVVDIGSRTVSYSQTLPFRTTGVVSDGNVDYVTTSAGELYVCSGLQTQQVAEKTLSFTLSNYSTAPYKYNFSSSSTGTKMAYGDDRLYLVDNRSNYVIYGSKLPGMQKSFCYGSPHYGNNASEIMEEISAIDTSGDILYIAYKTGVNYFVGSVFTNDYEGDKCPEGVIITRGQDMGDYSLEKAIEEIRVGMAGVGELYVSLDQGSFELAGLLTQTTLYQKIMSFKKNFREIAFMIKIQNEGGVSSNGSFKNLDLRFTSFPI